MLGETVSYEIDSNSSSKFDSLLRGCTLSNLSNILTYVADHEICRFELAPHTLTCMHCFKCIDITNSVSTPYLGWYYHLKDEHPEILFEYKLLYNLRIKRVKDEVETDYFFDSEGNMYTALSDFMFDEFGKTQYWYDDIAYRAEVDIAVLKDYFKQKYCAYPSMAFDDVFFRERAFKLHGIVNQFGYSSGTHRLQGYQIPPYPLIQLPNDSTPTFGFMTGIVLNESTNSSNTSTAYTGDDVVEWKQKYYED